MENCIIGFYHPIPISNQCFIHLIHILKRTMAETNDIRMAKMSI